MIDEIVSFDTAKLAKEKGFDENTSFYYDFEGVRRGYLGGQRNNSILSLWTDGGEKVSASTQSLLQKWLREAHNILVEVIFSYNDLPNWVVHVIDITKCDEDENSVLLSGLDFDPASFQTYEMALEAGITIALNLIDTNNGN